MKTIAFRITSVLGALLIATAVTLALAYAGDIGRGPLEHLFASLGNSVRKTEARIMLQSRTEKRSDKLQWFAPYASDAALLKNPGRMLLGAFDNRMQGSRSLESIVALEDSLATTFPLIQVYSAWGDKAEQEFPVRMAEGILQAGSVPVITWEPWLSAFDGSLHPQLRNAGSRDRNGMKDIAGGVYDFYIRKWAKAARAVEKTIFVRPGHEMNDPYRYPWGPQNNKAQDFIAAWKHIHHIFREEQADNVLWIWSPHPAYGYFKEFYPGDSVVDYIGINTLNYGTVAPWSQWWSFDDIFGKYYKDMEAFGKPIMLTELGSLEVGGSRSEWFAGALDSLPQKYPMVKALMFFHFSEDNTTTQQTLNWYIKDDTATTRAIRHSMGKWEQAGN